MTDATTVEPALPHTPKAKGPLGAHVQLDDARSPPADKAEPALYAVSFHGELVLPGSA